jgi:hypothetical protein
MYNNFQKNNMNQKCLFRIQNNNNEEEEIISILGNNICN